MGSRIGLAVVALMVGVLAISCATSPSVTIKGASSVKAGVASKFTATTTGAYPNYGVVHTDWGLAEGDGKACETNEITSGWSPPMTADENGVVVDTISLTLRTKGTLWLCAGSWIYPGTNGTDPDVAVDWHRVVVK